MKINQVRSALLKEKSGKCVCLESKRKRKSSSSHQLVLDHLPEGDGGDLGKVKVFDISQDKRKFMAFCFEHGEKAFFPVTDGTKVKLEELPLKPECLVTEDTFNERFLFQWGESATNDWRSLKSVAEPNMFLFVDKEKGKETVTINSVEEPSFRIKTVETKYLGPQGNRSSGSAETRTRNSTVQNQRAASKGLRSSGDPSEPKYARTQYSWSAKRFNSTKSTYRLKRKTKED